MIVCLVKKEKVPANTEANKIKNILVINSLSTVSRSKLIPVLYSSITLIEFRINPGVINNKILAAIIISNPLIRFFLYFEKYLFM